MKLHLTGWLLIIFQIGAEIFEGNLSALFPRLDHCLIDKFIKSLKKSSKIIF